MIGDLQVQLKEAEKLLATTKHERNNLLGLFQLNLN